ncbi:cellulase family glycosylhydrolase [Paenibacillus humicus]|uniref:cellulase family glycosylhydrolase n=1 Tax=Paenibacillus humicus TaxID=412861 RepID=UPI003D2705B4
MSRRLLKSLATMLLAVTVIAATAIVPGGKVSAAATPVKGFYVSGTTLYDATDKPFVMRGVNHAHTWFKNDLAAAIPAIAATGSNTVRIVLSDGGQWTRDDVASVQNIIALCDQYNLITMLEVHDATGSDSASTLNRAVDYWISIKDALIGKEDRVIVNIANEWFGSWSSDGWASGYQAAIPALRNAGIKNTLVVDAAGWGQYPNSIFEKGLAVASTDPLKNMIFSIHMYEYAGGDAATVKSNIDNALALNIPVIIGEFGHKHSSGDVDEATILSYTQQKGVGWLAWSWYGNGGGVEYLDLATGPAGSLTDWGKTVVNSTYGTLATSQLSGIYTTPGYQPVPDNGNTPVPTVPAAPTGLTAAAGNGQAVLSWNASSGATSYAVKRAAVSGGPYTTIASNVAATSYTDTGLTNGNTYYYVVSAANSAGTSSHSTQASVTPQGTPVPSSSLVLQYRAGDTNSSDNQIKPYFNIKNNGTSPVNLSSLKLRYYFTKDGNQTMNAWIDWAQVGSSNIQTAFGSVSGTNADTYVELSFTAAAGSIAPGGETGDIQLRMSKADWSNFNENNDYSFDATKTSYTDWNKVTLYNNGDLVWGIEP